MNSHIKELGPIPFPANTGERIYMQAFHVGKSLPTHLSRWQPTVDAMLQGVRVNGIAYLMADQGQVKTGTTHRRGGPHIDGNWNPGVKAHGGSTGTWVPTPPPSHSPWPPSHKPATGAAWDAVNFSPEDLFLANDVDASCCAYVGEIEGNPVEGGDCSHLKLSDTERVIMRASVGYVGNVTMVHESLPVNHDCLRTVVRINVPGFSFLHP